MSQPATDTNMGKPVSTITSYAAELSRQKQGRKVIERRLSTGHLICVTPQEDKMLKRVYDFLSGYVKRVHYESLLDSKKKELEELTNSLPAGAKAIINQQEQSSSIDNKRVMAGVVDDRRTQAEIKIDKYFQMKHEYISLEKKVKDFSSIDHNITFKDIDSVMKKLGVTYSKRQIEVL